MVTFDGFEDDEEGDAMQEIDTLLTNEIRNEPSDVSLEELEEIESLLVGWQDNVDEFPEFVRQARKQRKAKDEEFDRVEQEANPANPWISSVILCTTSARPS